MPLLAVDKLDRMRGVRPARASAQWTRSPTQPVSRGRSILRRCGGRRIAVCLAVAALLLLGATLLPRLRLKRPRGTAGSGSERGYSSGSGSLAADSLQTSGGGTAALDECLLGNRAAKRERLFLFVGIISARNNWNRRGAVRAAWADAAQVSKKSAVRFFVASQGAVDPPAEAELKAHNDFVWLDMPKEQNYRTIGDSTLMVFQHVVATYDFSFVLKTDDDSFVNVPALVGVLKQACKNTGCRHEALYMGCQVERIIVTHGQPQHPHNSDEFFEHTGLQEYPKYMVGGGYVISDDVARMLIAAQQTVGLKRYTVEDATFGYWLQAWDLRHINQSRFRTIADECCFGPPPSPGVTNYQLHDWVERDLCSSRPWLVLHKIVETEQMMYLGERVRNCTVTAADAISEISSAVLPAVGGAAQTRKQTSELIV